MCTVSSQKWQFRIFNGHMTCRYACLVITILYLASCQVRTYVQPTPNMPLLESKQDFRTNFYADLGNIFGGSQFQFAYSPVQNFGVQLNAHWDHKTGSTSIFNWDENEFKMRHFEGALGYYRNFDRNYFSVYGGYGFGYFNEASSFSESIFGGGTRTEQGSFGMYDKFFFQCSYWHKFQPWLDFGMAYRKDINYYSRFAFFEIMDPRDPPDPIEEFFYERAPFKLHVGNFIFNLRFDLGDHLALYYFMGASMPITINEFHLGRPFLGYTLQFQISHSDSHKEWYRLKRERKEKRRQARREEYLRNLYR